MKRLLAVLVAAVLSLGLLGSIGCMIHGCGGCGDGNGPPTRQGDPQSGAYVYKCPMDGAVIESPGPCPKCGMTLDERHRVAKQ